MLTPRRRMRAHVKRLERAAAAMNATLLMVAIGLGIIDLAVASARTLALDLPPPETLRAGGAMAAAPLPVQSAPTIE